MIRLAAAMVWLAAAPGRAVEPAPALAAAEARLEASDFDGALKAVEPLLGGDEVDPAAKQLARVLGARALHGRGEEHFRRGRAAAAVADFDREIELLPDVAAAHWQRGIACYYAGQFAEGARQFELHRTVNPQDVENAAWHFLCVARSPGGSVEAARRGLIEVTRDERAPMALVQRMFAGAASPDEVLRAGEQAGGAAKFYADLYVGLYYEALGRGEESLRLATLAAENLAAKQSYMGDVARVHVQLRKPAKRAAARPNIVFILADDLGYTDLGCYGSKYYETPNIDRLAAEGVRFTDGYTCGPNCQPTRAALMSGQYGPRTGVYTVGDIDRFNWRSRPLRPVDNVTALPMEKIAVADALRSAGYATGMFGKWHLGNGAGRHPSRRGFDEAIESSGVHFNFRTRPPVEAAEGAYLADFLTDRAVDFIERRREGPFFLYLPHYAVHAPHQAKGELIDRFREKAPAGGHRDPTYAAMIASVDESVGRIVATLERLGLAENTLVIFSSDNGGVGGYAREGLGEKGITDNAPLRGGKGMLYEGGVRVPYIFRWPGTIAAGRSEGTLVNSVDLYPTLLELAGADPPADYPLDGVSYAGVLRGEGPAAERDGLYWHFPGYLGFGRDQWRTTPCGSVRSGDWKLIEYFEDGRLELYNLRDDAGETRNLAADEPEKVAELREKMLAWRESVGAKLPTPRAVGDDDASDEPRRNRGGRRARRERRSASEAPAGAAVD